MTEHKDAFIQEMADMEGITFEEAKFRLATAESHFAFRKSSDKHFQIRPVSFFGNFVAPQGGKKVEELRRNLPMQG